MTIAVPAVDPVTEPPVPNVTEPDPAVVLHVPPVTASVNVIVLPTHVDGVPFMVPGTAYTVTIAVAVQMPPIV